MDKHNRLIIPGHKTNIITQSGTAKQIIQQKNNTIKELLEKLLLFELFEHNLTYKSLIQHYNINNFTQTVGGDFCVS